MSNFRFVEPIWPELFTDCVRAEGYLRSDPRSACIYGRRVTERLVDYLYDVLQLPLPYRDDVNARINDCLLYTSDAADDLLCVDLGGRRIIKKKNNTYYIHNQSSTVR